jgi:hypothetical protein
MITGEIDFSKDFVREMSINLEEELLGELRTSKRWKNGIKAD